MRFERLARQLDQASWRWVVRLAERRVLASLVIGLVAALAYLPGQTVLPAIDRTEPVVALSSRHIVETGDVLRPAWGVNVQRKRPVGTFWLQALSIGGRDDAAQRRISSYRLPSMIATVLGVVLIYMLGRGLFGAPAAWMAAITMAVTPLVVLHAQLAIAEPLILPAIVIAQLSLFAIYRSKEDARWWGWRGAFWLALGISTWFNALAVPLLALVTVAALGVLDRSFGLIQRLRPLVGLAMLGVMAIPWLGAVAVIDGGIPFRDLSIRALLDHLEGGQDMKFKTVYGIFVLTLVLGFLPVQHVLGPVITSFWRDRGDLTVRFLLVWLIAPIIALEIFSNKPPLYTVQAVMPAGALLTALAVGYAAPYAREIRAWPGMFWGTVVLVCVLAPMLTGLVLWLWQTPPTFAVVAGLIVFAALFVFAAWASAHGLGMAWYAAGMMATLVFGLWFNGALMAGLRHFWTAPQLRQVYAGLQHCAPSAIAIIGFREPSLALALAGKARLGTPADAAAVLAGPASGFAIVEARMEQAFRGALQAGPMPPSVKLLGCVRSFNIARGCSLKFNVYARTHHDVAARCRQRLLEDCNARHNFISATLKIKHCR